MFTTGGRVVDLRTSCLHRKVTRKMCSNEDDIMQAAAIFIILTKKKRKHKYWVRPSLKGRKEHGGIELLNTLRRDDLLAGRIEDGHIRNFLRMTDSDFERLLNVVGPRIKKTDTNYRKAITPTERLLITLRFLATGDSYTSLMYLFRISKQAISKIVPEVCTAMYEVLEDQIKMPVSAEEWKEVATQFNNLWNFPQCVGVMDGKHIMIQSPEHSGSDFFNYKSFFSIVLFIVANANYEVIYMNVGCQGRISDGGVFENTRFKKMLTQCKLNLPNNENLPGRTTAVPYVFLGDDAFPLLPNLMKPYPGAQEKGSQERIFNYRLSRARRVSENVFGILSARFRVLRKIMLLDPSKVEVIVTACIYLHNYLRKSTSSRATYTPPGTFDSEDKDTGNIISGGWRNEQNDIPFQNLDKKARKSSNAAKEVRQEFAEYFMSPQGKVPWQNNY